MTGADGALPARRRRLVRLAAAQASGDARRLGSALDGAERAVASGELRRAEVEEVLLQSHLFLGYPAAISALEAWRERVPGAAPEVDPLAEPEGAGAWRERGEAVCRRVYGRAYGALRRRMRSLHPALDRWAVTEGYGKVLGRPGLPLPDRELCIAALLAVRGREPQLHSHLRGALAVGAGPEAVEAALGLALEAAGPAERRTARTVWRKVRRRAAERGGSGDGDSAAGDGVAEAPGPAGPA